MASLFNDPITVSNPKCGLDKDVLAVMNKRRDAHIAELRERAARAALLQPTEEERQARQLIRSRLVAAAGLSDGDLERIANAKRSWRERVKGLHKARAQPRSHPPLDPKPFAGEGEFWWAQTTWWWDANRGLTPDVRGSFEADGLHLEAAGLIAPEDLWTVNVWVLAQFGLGPDRMPRGNTGPFASGPLAELNGTATGETFYDFWPWDDNWAKLWLNTTQDLSGGILSPGQTVGHASNDQSSRLIFIETDNDFHEVDLPGFFTMPRIQQFFIFDPTQPIIGELKFNFHFELEGEADVGIDSVVLNTPQWVLTPA
jgi:hypothetical protein